MLWQDRKVAAAVGESAKVLAVQRARSMRSRDFRIAKSLALQKWEFAKRAQPYADKMLDVLVAVANNVEAPEAARVSAAGKIIDRALGKAPQHGDVTALHHTEIVYRSAAEIRQELINRGVPEVLLDYSSKDSNDK
jgi:nitroreductase